MRVNMLRCASPMQYGVFCVLASLDSWHCGEQRKTDLWPAKCWLVWCVLIWGLLKGNNYWLNGIIIRYANVERCVRNGKRFMLIATLNISILFSASFFIFSLRVFRFKIKKEKKIKYFPHGRQWFYFLPFFFSYALISMNKILCSVVKWWFDRELQHT